MLRQLIGAVLGFALLVAGLAGCSGDGGDGGGGLPTGNLTVTARVISFIGEPTPDAPVWLSGHGPFRTDANGEVTIHDLPSPYEAVVVDAASGVAHFWPSLTRSDPVFSLTTAPAPVNGALVDGSVTGGVGWPVPATHVTDVHLVYHDAWGFSSTSPDPTTGAYSFGNAQWFGPLTTPATLYGIQFLADLNGDPVSFTGFGSLSIPLLTTSSALVNQDIALLPVPTSMITGTLTLPPGVTAVDEVVILRPLSGGTMALPSTATFMPSFSKVAPVVPDVARELLVLAARSPEEIMIVVRQNLPDPALNIVIDVPEMTGQVLPVEGALGVSYATQFQITPTPGNRVFSVRFGPNPGPGPMIILHTTESTFTIPDLSEFGFGIPQGSAYEWSVTLYGPLASLDEAAVAPTLFNFFPITSNGSGDAFASFSPTRSFTFGQ